MLWHVMAFSCLNVSVCHAHIEHYLHLFLLEMSRILLSTLAGIVIDMSGHLHMIFKMFPASGATVSKNVRVKYHVRFQVVLIRIGIATSFFWTLEQFPLMCF